jgi:hypothetical protein
MGGHGPEKFVFFQRLNSIYFRSNRRRDAPRLTPGKPIFKQNMAGNKSGALLLTIWRFTITLVAASQRFVQLYVLPILRQAQDEAERCQRLEPHGERV